MRSSDASCWQRMLASIREADGTFWESFTEEELLEDFSDPLMDFEKGSIGAFDGEEMAAYATLIPRPRADPVHEMRFDGGVHPRYRRNGLGHRLLDWVEKESVVLHCQRFPGRPLELSGSSPTTNTAAISLIEGRGYRPVRWFNGMVVDLSKPLIESPPVEGCLIASWSPDHAMDALSIRNEAFRDHRGSTETTPEVWAHSLATAGFRPEFSFVAFCDGEAAGFLTACEYEMDPKIGRDLYISLVGTRRAHRKKGIATALVTTVLKAAKEAGFAIASLEVDAESPTGALAVYERIGFKLDHRSVTMNKEVLTGEG